MKIAFDLDDTLTPTNQNFTSGSEKLKFPFSLFFKEKLRCGAVELINELAKEHEVWVYTTSLRSVVYIKSWFYFSGIKLHGIINNQIHSKKVTGTKYSGYSKAPSLFGISVMIDDLPGVKIECDQQNCESIILEPTDNEWVIKVQRDIQFLTRRCS